MRTLSGVAALSVATDFSRLGRMRWLRMASAVPDTSPHDRLEPDWYRRKIAQVQQKMKERKLNAMVLLTRPTSSTPPDISIFRRSGLWLR